MTGESVVLRLDACSLIREADGRWTAVYRGPPNPADPSLSRWRQGPVGSFWAVAWWALARGLLW